MDAKGVGQLLSMGHPVEGGLGGMLDILGMGESSLVSSFLPSMMLLVPQAYRARSSRRVDLCGMVEQSTAEYEEGLRYYSSEGELFYADGKCFPETENPCDLVDVIAPDDLRQTTKPMSPYLWVHPQHWPMKAWFASLIPDKSEISEKSHYLNRMGLVISITGVIAAPGKPVTFSDSEDRRYNLDGSVVGKDKSMFDLVSCIRHWSQFDKIDWSSDKGITKKVLDGGAPEMFDPTGGNKRELFRRFFASMNETVELAETLGIDLKFEMNNKLHFDL
jgi:hypothetical protein